MRRSGSILGLALVVGVANAAPPIPEMDRIPAMSVRVLVAPDAQPMRMPTDVAVDSRGRVFVADGVNNRIVRFTAGGAFDGVITGPSDKPFSRPIGIAIDVDDHLWVADSGNVRILSCDADGVPGESFGVPSTEDGHTADPTDVIVTSDRARTYVVDNDNHRVLIRDNASGKWLARGEFGRALGQFEWPFMISIGSQGDVLVSEAIGARVQRISARDLWAGIVGRWGVAVGEFYRPKGVATDHAGRIYVSDSTIGVVQVFEANGRLLGVLTDADNTPLRFAHPMGLWVDKQGLVYVVELTANRVAVIALRRSLDARGRAAQGSPSAEQETR